MKQIVVQIPVKAEIEKVWIYWTSPEHIVHWNFASDDWACPRAKNELKPHGKFSWRMEAKDGSVGFDFEGIYDEIIENKSIAYHMTDNRKVLVSFSQIGNEIHIKESFDTDGVHSEEQQRVGWQAILENFKKYIES